MVETHRHVVASSGGGSAGRGPSCAACGAPLGRLDAAVGDHCRTLACRTAVSVRRHREAARALDARDEAAARRFFAHRPEVEATVHLPASGRALARHDPARAARFRANLAAAMAEAVALALSDAWEREEPALGAGRPELEAGCALCRGHCCRHGGDHAFLTAPQLAKRLGADPAGAAEGLIEAYMARLPAASSADACVFQGPAGCVLDRPDRADICNEYLCGGLQRLAGHLDRGLAVGVAAVADGTVRRSATVAPSHLPAAAPPV